MGGLGCQMEAARPAQAAEIAAATSPSRKRNDLAASRVLSHGYPPRKPLCPVDGYFFDQKTYGKLETAKMISQQNQKPNHTPGAPSLQRSLLAGFGPRCLDEVACARLLAYGLKPDGLICPSCGCQASAVVYPLPPRRIRCTGCGRRFTAFSGTVLEGCKLPVPQVALMLLLLALGHDNATVAALAGVSAETARVWRAKLEAA